MNNKKEINQPVEPKKNEKHPKFYIAMLLCLTAVSAAGWSTYKTVQDFVSPQKSNNAKISKSKNSTNSQKTTKTSILDENNTDLEKSDKQNKTAIAYDKKTSGKDDCSTLKKDKKNNENEESKPVWAEKNETLVSQIVYPCDNNIVKEFSDEKPMYSKTLDDWRCHEAIDFKAEKGSDVKSISSGIVTDIYDDPSYGTTVIISHDTASFIAYYSGLDKNVLIKKGDKVKSGDKIGTIDVVPCEISDGESHLHLAITKNNKFIDPLLVLDKES